MFIIYYSNIIYKIILYKSYIIYYIIYLYIIYTCTCTNPYSDIHMQIIFLKRMNFDSLGQGAHLQASKRQSLLLSWESYLSFWLQLFQLKEEEIIEQY